MSEDAEGYRATAARVDQASARQHGKALGTKWSEIDMDRVRWTIPTVNTKTRKEHGVPLGTLLASGPIYLAKVPPSTGTNAPVMKAAPSPTRNARTSATSSGVP